MSFFWATPYFALCAASVIPLHNIVHTSMWHTHNSLADWNGNCCATEKGLQRSGVRVLAATSCCILTLSIHNFFLLPVLFPSRCTVGTRRSFAYASLICVNNIFELEWELVKGFNTPIQKGCILSSFYSICTAGRLSIAPRRLFNPLRALDRRALPSQPKVKRKDCVCVVSP